MIYRIRHTTTYSYSEPVSLCNNVARLTPREGNLQATIDSELQIQPFPAVTSEWVDYFGNPATFFAIQEPHEELIVTAHHVARVTPYVPPDAEASPPWEAVRDALRSERTPETIDAYQFAFDSPYIRANAELRRYADLSFSPGRPLLAGALDLTKRIHADFKYDPRATTVSTPLAEVLANRRGVPGRPPGHRLLPRSAWRRYVSGYMHRAAPGRPRLVARMPARLVRRVLPATAANFDPTNNQIPTDKHIHVAWGATEDVSPIKGVILGGGQHTVKVAVDVVPDEEPHGLMAPPPHKRFQPAQIEVPPERMPTTVLPASCSFIWKAAAVEAAAPSARLCVTRSKRRIASAVPHRSPEPCRAHAAQDVERHALRTRRGDALGHRRRRAVAPVSPWRARERNGRGTFRTARR